jgi:DNA-binding NtrC family response regulator
VTHARQAVSGRTLSELEEELIRTTLAECRGVKARAARQLGIPRSTLYHLLERYGID